MRGFMLVLLIVVALFARPSLAPACPPGFGGGGLSLGFGGGFQQQFAQPFAFQQFAAPSCGQSFVPLGFGAQPPVIIIEERRNDRHRGGRLDLRIGGRGGRR